MRERLTTGMAPSMAVIDGWQQTMSELLAQPDAPLSPRELAVFYGRALLSEERHKPNDLDAQRDVALQLRQAFVRTVGSLAMPYFLEQAAQNLIRPAENKPQKSEHAFTGYGGRLHGGTRAVIAEVALGQITQACEDTLANMDLDHLAGLTETFKHLSERTNDLSGQILDRDLGPVWRNHTWSKKDILSDDFRLNGKSVSPATRLVLLGSDKTPDLSESFVAAAGTGAEYGALSIIGMRRALETAGYAETSWDAHIASRLRMLALPANLPFWLAHGFAANRESEASVRNLYMASPPDDGALRMSFTNGALQRFYELDQRMSCQGAAVEPCFAPNGEASIRAAYSQIDELTQLNGERKSSDIDPESIKDGQMSSAMAVSWLTLTVALER